MNIGLFTESYYPTINGVSNHLSYLKKGLEEAGHTVHLFCPDQPGYREREENVHRIQTVMSSAPVIDRLLGVEMESRVSLPLSRPQLQIVNELDIIHAHHMVVLGAYARSYARLYDIPLVLTNHSQFEAIPPFNESLLALSAIRGLARIYTDDCACVISPGEGMKRALLEDYGVRKPIRVIPNGVDLERFRRPADAAIEELRRSLGFAPDDRILLYAGRLSREKNLHFLLQAVAPLLHAHDDVKLLIVGGGVLHDDLVEAAAALGLGGKVTFTGYIPFERVNEYFALADVFVTGSKSEVFPLSLIEALAVSLPIVAVDAVGTSDVVADGVTGFLTADSLPDFGGAVGRLVEDESLRQAMAQAATQHARKWSIEASVNAHLDVYEQFARERPRVAYRWPVRAYWDGGRIHIGTR